MPTGAQLIDRVVLHARLNGSGTNVAASKVWMEDNSGGTYADETTDAGDVGTADVTFSAGTFDINDAVYVGYSAAFAGITFDASTAGVGTDTVANSVWEYWNGALWVPLQNVNDGGQAFTQSGTRKVAWSIPLDWTTTTVSSGGALYYVRFRATANSIYATTKPVLSTLTCDAQSNERALVCSYLQEAADMIAFDAEAVHDPSPTSVSLTAGTAEYDITASPFNISGLIAFDELRITDPSVTNYPVDQVSMSTIDAYRTGAQASTTPYVYAFDYPMLVLYPAPQSSSTIECKMVADAPTIGDNNSAITFVPKAIQWGTLVNFALAKALQYKQQKGWEAYMSAALSDRVTGLPAARRWVARAGGRQGIQPGERGPHRTSPSQDFGPFR